MSGNESPSLPSVDELVTVRDVEQELNFLEQLRNSISGDDEYLEAMLTNMRLQAMWMIQSAQSNAAIGALPQNVQLEDNQSPAGFDTDQRVVPQRDLTSERYLPLSAVGIANRIIYENDTGPATVQVQGTVRSATVRVDETVAAGDPVYVVAPGNIVDSISDVSLSLLGLGGSVNAGSFEQKETAQGNVSISPGETKTVVEANIRGADWVAVGTNDEQHSEYDYIVDGESILDSPLLEPLGLYNDPYRFRPALNVDNEIRVDVTRQASATGSADYFSKLQYYE